MEPGQCPDEAQALQDHIDALLEQYLTLLDSYSKLRASLASSHVSMYQAIARANFSAERGTRFDQGCYDQRMQASRRLCIQQCGGQDENEKNGMNDDGEENSGARESGTVSVRPWMCHVIKNHKDNVNDEKNQEDTLKTYRMRDPIRWFGPSPPSALRAAQTYAIDSVTELVPSLVMVDADMKAVEYEVGRAREKRAAMTARQMTLIGQPDEPDVVEAL